MTGSNSFCEWICTIFFSIPSWVNISVAFILVVVIVSLWMCMYLFVSGEDLLACMEILRLRFWGVTDLFPSHWMSLHSHQGCLKIPIRPHPCQQLLFCGTVVNYPSGYEVVFHCGCFLLLFFVVLGLKLRVLCLLGKCSIIRATPQSFAFSLFFQIGSYR
jgi:hypothetical protein